MESKTTLIDWQPNEARVERFRLYVEGMKPIVRWVLRSSERASPRIRKHFAAKHLHGSGIEIGAGMRPLRTPKGQTQVRYVDVHPEEEQVELYGFNPKLVARVDVITEADDLSPFDDNSLDFVVANHVLARARKKSR